MGTKVSKILTQHGSVGNIARILGVSPTTVTRALSGRHPMTKKALQIRATALKNGAAEVKN